MNKKQTIKLNENQLRRIVKESVKKMLKEGSTFRFDNTPMGTYNKMSRYDSLIGELINVVRKMKKLSGKSSTMQSNDSIDSKVWNLAHEISSLIEQYGLDENSFNPDDWYPDERQSHFDESVNITSKRKSVLKEEDFMSSYTGEVLDENTTIYYHITQESGYEDKYPRTPSKWEYSYDVVRIFTASKHYAEYYNSNYTGNPVKECTLKDLFEICPLSKELIYDVLFNKKSKIFNVYEEIKRNKKTGEERWEIEVGYHQYETVSTSPSKDRGWYKPYTYEETNLSKLLKDGDLYTE